MVLGRCSRWVLLVVLYCWLCGWSPLPPAVFELLPLLLCCWLLLGVGPLLAMVLCWLWWVLAVRPPPAGWLLAITWDWWPLLWS